MRLTADVALLLAEAGPPQGIGERRIHRCLLRAPLGTALLGPPVLAPVLAPILAALLAPILGTAAVAPPLLAA